MRLPFDMDVEMAGCSASGSPGGRIEEKPEKDRLLVRRKALQSVLEQCQRALELLNEDRNCYGDARDFSDEGLNLIEVGRGDGSSDGCLDRESYGLCDLIKSQVDCHEFLQKLENTQLSLSGEVVDQSSSWDMIDKNDLWDGGSFQGDAEDYIFIGQEDIMEGIASFMAAYVFSLRETKVLTPIQLQEALRRTFSVKRKKGKLRKAWDGSKVVYNIASWGATAVGIYQNPIFLRVASTAFWASCDAVSKFF